MEEQHHEPRPSYLPALAFVGVLIGFQNLAIRSDSTPDPFLRPALSVTQAFRLPPELRPAQVSYRSFPGADASTLDVAVPDPAQFEEIETSFESWAEPPHEGAHDAAALSDDEEGDEGDDEEEFVELPAATAPPMDDPGAVIDRANRQLELAATEPSQPAPPSLRVASPPVLVRADRAPTPSRAAAAAPQATPPAAAQKSYVVQAGDTLYGIARRFEMPVAQIMNRNPHLGNIHDLKPGMELTIAGAKSLTHKVESGESLWSIARFYDLTVGEVLTANDLASPTIFVNQTLNIPTASLSTEKLELAMRKRRARQRGYMMPVFGRTTDHFGMRQHPILQRQIAHRGLDIAASEGAPIRATQAGVVSFSGWLQGYGNLIEVRHSNGITSRYGHCSKLVKKKGERVTKGELVAEVGMTGLATAPHLHFEIRKRGTPEDPLKFL